MLATLSEQIQTVMATHVGWALLVAFAVSCGEALLVIGLFVPSTVVLVGAGTLAGAGKLPLAELFAVTVAGATLGDALSYWVGRHYGERLLRLWPVRNYPDLVLQGRAYFAANGGRSVFVGRFIPAVKSIVPGVAGMMGMPPGKFTVVNLVSAVFWAAAHIFPGVAIGVGLGAMEGVDPFMISVGLGVLLTLSAVWRPAVARLRHWFRV